ncbi:hypothetical protein QYM36_007974 [Artemia franciscana]|uniref:Uncharacterized protein n=1 Tax=Artemia franciscana TaxID=6661 RepID=A0AA88INW7_ARTSF|nr:hypothetical protein QYM36_007974 [Artemia franciscana]
MLHIYNQVRRKLEDEHGANISGDLKGFMSAKNTIFHARCATCLAEPASQGDIQLGLDWKVTKRSEAFLARDSVDIDRVLIFATDENQRRLVIVDRWFVDGTFRVAPKQYKHLFYDSRLR